MDKFIEIFAVEGELQAIAPAARDKKAGEPER